MLIFTLNCQLANLLLVSKVSKYRYVLRAVLEIKSINIRRLTYL